MGVTSFRLDDKLLKELDRLAKKRHLDRSTTLKQTLEIGLKKIKLEDALEEYRNGKISAWRAASNAELSLWQFLDILEQRRMEFKTAQNEIEEQLESL